MSQKLIVAAVVVIIAAVGWWFFQNRQQNNATGGVANTETTAPEQNQEEASEAGLFTGRLSDLMARHQSVECQFTTTDPKSGDPVRGTLNTDGNQFMMSMETTANGSLLTMRMLKDGTTLYMWSDDADAMPGMKIENGALPPGTTEPPSSPASFLDNQGAMTQYDCQPWTAQADSFAVPADVTFTDMADLMPKGLPSTLPPSQNSNGTSGLAPVPGTSGDTYNYSY